MRSAALSAIRGRPKRKTAADPNGQGRLERAGRPAAHARIKNTNRRCAALSATRRHRRAHKKYLGTSFQPIFGAYNASGRFSSPYHRKIRMRSRRRSITAPQHHGATASRHLHSITAPQHHGTDAETAACPQELPRTRRFTATSSHFVSRATVSLRRSARSAGWQRLGVGCPRPRSVRPSTRVRPRPRRPAAARRRRRMG